jgi:hypothetical protein
MRSREFVSEQKVGDIGQRKSVATVGLNKFRDKQYADRVYELNRVMMAVATTDGTNEATIDSESWAGRNNVAAPYTKIEQKMLEKAFKAVGSHHSDMNNGDLDSEELPSTNKQSPMQAFKGYPR